MLLEMLRNALSDRRRNIRITREIEEGKDIRQLSVSPIKDDVELNLEQKWWLQKFFDKINLSFSQGALLIYALVEFPRLLLFPFIIGQTQEYLVVYISAFFVEMFVSVVLLLMHSIYKGLVQLKSQTNNILRAKKFVAPTICVRAASGKELTSKDFLDDLDNEYRNRYIKPVMFKTLQDGLSLSFNRSYQLGSGIIFASLFFLIVLLRFVLNVIPPNVFFVLELGVPEIALAYRVLFFLVMGFNCFVIGMLAWALFVTFLVIIQASGNAIGIRPYESLKEYFEPATTLILKTFFTLTFLLAWLSPFVVVLSMFHPDPFHRQATVAFVGTLLILMIPVIILYLLLPIFKIHKGMEESRKRALIVKRYELEEIEKIRKSDLDMYFRIRKHLIDDYKDIQRNPEWVFNSTQIVELVGTVLLPIITFLIRISI